MNRRKTKENVEKLREMSKMLRDSADALDEVIAAIEVEDESKTEDAMGRFVMKLFKLKTLQDML